MGAKVVDASAIAAIVFNEPEGPLVVEQLADAELIAPGLLGFELASVCIKKIRRDPARSAELLRVFSFRNALAIDIAAVDHDAVARLARDTGLSAYDASYLWLSRFLGADLVTLDRRLARAAAGDPP